MKTLLHRPKSGDIIEEGNWRYTFKQADSFSLANRIAILFGKRCGWKAEYIGDQTEVLRTPCKQMRGYPIIDLDLCFKKYFNRYFSTNRVIIDNRGYNRKCNYYEMLLYVKCNILDISRCTFEIHPSIIYELKGTCKILILNYSLYKELFIFNTFRHIIYCDELLVANEILQAKISSLTGRNNVRIKSPDKLDKYLAKVDLMGKKIHAVLIVDSLEE